MALPHQYPLLHPLPIFLKKTLSSSTSILENMGEVKTQNIPAMTQSLKAHYLIKLSPLLVSVSLCSFYFSPSSLLAFLHYFNLYFSTFPLQLFSHTIDKNCMFLLCNGLLVFVGITRSFSGSNLDDEPEPSKNVEDGSNSQFSDVEAKEPMVENQFEGETCDPSDEQIPDAEPATEIKYSAEEVEKEEDIEKAIVEDEDQGKEKEEEEPDEESGKLDAGDDEEEEEEKGSESDDFLIEENVEEREIMEEENCTVSTEEMNKKFDDFIKRMKEGLRIEAQRRLVMV